MNLRLPRYSINDEGTLIADSAGTLCLLQEVDAGVTPIEQNLESAETDLEKVTAAARAAAAEAAQAKTLVETYSQGIRQAQADLAHIMPTDMDKSKQELVAEIEALKSKVNTL